MSNNIDINLLAQNILEKNELITVVLKNMTISARPFLPDFQFLLKRGKQNVFFTGTKLVLQLYFNDYRISLLDTDNYACIVHIGTFYVSEYEIKKIKYALGGEIETLY